MAEWTEAEDARVDAAIKEAFQEVRRLQRNRDIRVVRHIVLKHLSNGYLECDAFELAEAIVKEIQSD